jgi:group I intron endonuclease
VTPTPTQPTTSLNAEKVGKETRFLAYKVTNLVNWKGYIGITTNPQMRWANHRWCPESRRRVFQHAIHKYGQENFRFEIIAEAYSRKELLVLERALIAEHGTFARTGGGYNRTIGGEGTAGWRRTPEQIARMSAARKGFRHTPETKAKLSAMQTGKKCGPRAPMTAEQKAKISAAQKGRRRDPAAIAKSAAGLKGHICSPETREKIAASRRGRKEPPEVTAKRAAALRRRAQERRARKAEWQPRLPF